MVPDGLGTRLVSSNVRAQNVPFSPAYGGESVWSV